VALAEKVDKEFCVGCAVEVDGTELPKAMPEVEVDPRFWTNGLYRDAGTPVENNNFCVMLLYNQAKEHVTYREVHNTTEYTRVSLSGRTKTLFKNPITNYILTSNLAR
jgi:hypothetical protein